MCYGVEGGRGHWEATFPTMGINFKSWIQKKERAQDGECENTDYQIQIRDNCFSYEVMTKICLLVKYQKEADTSDFVEPSYKWTYTGGCFNDGHPVLYEQALPFHNYDFSEVEVDIRLDHRETEFFEQFQESNSESPVLLNPDGSIIEEQSTNQPNEKKAAKVESESMQ